MSAQIIAFPKLATATDGIFVAANGIPAVNATSPQSLESGLHLVKRSVIQSNGGSQQAALRIVANVCAEHNLLHPSVERSDEFWATLPLPSRSVETPLSVMRRLAHMLLLAGELA